MNNFKKSLDQQILEAQQLKEAPTEKEQTICKNFRFGLAIALSMSILLYIAERICS